jgi:DNA-directed RNA polymerase specialized sigma24 family protein
MKSQVRTCPPTETFATTHWSVVLAAGGASTPNSRHAWEQLARDYWRPLYAHARRNGHSHEDAQDLVQGFFALMLEKPFLHRAQRERGRFRTFLLAALDHFLANQHDRANALKRGGGFEFVACPDNESGVEPASPEIPIERQFDREWAQTIFDHALRRLEQEFVQEGKQTQFAALAPFLSQPPGDGDYERIAAQLGIRARLMATVVSRLRRRFRDLVRAQIAGTVATTAEIDAELSYLVDLMAGSS